MSDSSNTARSSHLHPLRPRAHRRVFLEWALPALALGVLPACGSEASRPSSEEIRVDPLPAEVSTPAPGTLTNGLLDCAVSPFGRRLLVGGEHEVYVGFRASQGHPFTFSQERGGAAGAETLDRLWTFSNAESGRNSTSLHRTVAADLNGDGRSELVHSFKDASNGTQFMTVTNPGTGSPSVSYWYGSNLNNYRATASAAGNLDRSSNADDELVWGFIDSDNMLQVFMFDGSATGTINHANGSAQGYWRRSTAAGRVGVRYLDMATGDLDGDGFDDEIVLAFLDGLSMVQLVVLKFESGYTLPNSQAVHYRELATTSIGLLGTETSELKVAVGNIDGDFKDELVVGFGVRDPDVTMATQLQLRTFKLGPSKTTLNPLSSWDRQFRFRNLGLAIGDTDRDGLGEIALAFHGFESSITGGPTVINIGTGFNALTLNAEYSTLIPQNHLYSPADSRTSLDSLSLAVGDLDKDGMQDLVAGFRDSGNALQLVRLEDQQTPGAGLQLLSSRRDTTLTSASGISVALGDWTDDSLRGHYEPVTGSTLRCQTVVEPQISSAIFVPPFWKNINWQLKSGSIGESSRYGESNESSVTTTSSHSVSGYIGGGVDAEAFEVAVKVTGGYEWSASQTRTTGKAESRSITTGWTNSDDFAVVENHTYNCYSYQVRQGTTPIDAWARFCELQSISEESPVLNTWDVQYSPLNNANTSQWAPVVRDWSNLALFRGGSAVQSSTDWGGVASRAADGNLDGVFSRGSMTQTYRENTPWWQIDLGSSQQVGKVRVWNRSKSDYCDEGPCRERLQNFYVFVSDTDFRTISNDPNVLKNDSRVRVFSYADVVGEVGTVLTLQQGAPVTGRYVRVQLAGVGILSLAEVQIFGANHVEPDSYPMAVQDLVKNDGKFEALIYNKLTATAQWVSVRGNLLWNGANDNVLGGKTIGPGGGIASWSLIDERTNTQTSADAKSNTARVGISMEASIGAIKKVHLGVAYEFASGVTRSESRTLSWTNSLELGGGVGGFPSTINGQVVLWPSQCNYQVRPYYYEVTDRSNDGFEHRFLVVDYLVPDGLNRAANMTPCLNGQFSPAFAPAVEERATTLESSLR
ncbi:MAG TPA: discoidin domain-containing protein [Archangium sp.]|uniref:galactose-binding domain-containing protein n=1 Tax=Archangium sp. TaxID=1872627 RepID=UPI002E2ED1D7|nr:discoidin domain-containing protein [Archangium sp.]HEX5745872.1 discoidin domain-containing protein [Archangium sp.]